MTTADTLSVALARLAELSRLASHMMSELGGLTRLINNIEIDPTPPHHINGQPGSPDPEDPMAWRAIYRGTALGGEAPVRWTRPTVEEGDQNSDVSRRLLANLTKPIVPSRPFTDKQLAEFARINEASPIWDLTAPDRRDNE